MLTPELHELLELCHPAQTLGLTTKHRTQAPLSGLYASVFRGHGIDFDEVREYQPGDEIRNIDWRVTARMGKPYLKVYREERERSVVLCIDTSPYMQFGTRGTFKTIQAARIAALLGWSAQTHGDRISGILFGQGPTQWFRPQRAKHSFLRLLRSLTIPPLITTSTSSSTLEEALMMLNRSTHTGALVFIIGDLHHTPIPSLRRSLTQLHQRYELVLITIDDPADYDLPAIGKVTFVSPAGTPVTIDTDHKQGRLAYRRVWENHRQELQQLVQQLAIDLFILTTHTDPYQGLLENLQQRALQQRTHR